MGKNGLYTIFNPEKNQKFGMTRRVVRNTPNLTDSYLPVNFALLNPYHLSLHFEPARQLITAVGFISNLCPIILLWVHFQGHDEPVKSLKFRNYANFLRDICNRVKI